MFKYHYVLLLCLLSVVSWQHECSAAYLLSSAGCATARQPSDWKHVLRRWRCPVLLQGVLQTGRTECSQLYQPGQLHGTKCQMRRWVLKHNRNGRHSRLLSLIYLGRTTQWYPAVTCYFLFYNIVSKPSVLELKFPGSYLANIHDLLINEKAKTLFSLCVCVCVCVLAITCRRPELPLGFSIIGDARSTYTCGEGLPVGCTGSSPTVAPKGNFFCDSTGSWRGLDSLRAYMCKSMSHDRFPCSMLTVYISTVQCRIVRCCGTR